MEAVCYLFYKKAKKSSRDDDDDGAVQTGREKALGRPKNGLSVSKVGYKKEGLFSRIFCDRTRRNYSKLEEVRFGLDILKKVIVNKDSEG